MAHLFIELLSEEIPALMQKRAREEFKNLGTTFLEQAGLHHGEIQVYSTPRRLVLSVYDVPLEQSDREEVIKGPRVDGPSQAIEGFLKTNQITLETCAEEETPKGTFYVLKKQIKGQKTVDVLPTIVREIIARFSWPKSMVWGTSARSWVRPLQSGLCFL
ncbi:MAG: glycine--tRNA ligase subunit beta, partial [Alphaproteobacteria bacterium]|nr:glycine--tRNA ligase subunit beta [Alphaproteobacteria bacterium]